MERNEIRGIVHRTREQVEMGWRPAFLCPQGIKTTRPEGLVGSLTKDAAERGIADLG